MKRTILLALTITLLLPGCAGAKQTPQDFTRWQQTLSAASEICFSARITGQWSQGTASFSADVVRTGEDTAVTVTAPETIAGISFHSAGGSGTLEYDGVILELAPGVTDTLSPCAAAGILLEALTRGNLIYAGAEQEYLTASIAAPGGETVTVWRTEGDVPVYAEIGNGETTELTLSLEGWEIKE